MTRTDTIPHHSYVNAWLDEQSTPVRNVARAVATLLSYVFHPVFMPVLMLLLLYKLSPVTFSGMTTAVFGKRYLLPVALNTLLFPLLFVALLRALGFIKNVQLHTPRERMLPLLGIMVFYFWAQHVILNMPVPAGIPKVPTILKVLLLGSFWSVIVVFMISIFYKISMHAMAAGGVLGLLIVLMMLNPIDMFLPLCIVLLTGGAVGTARLVLRAHSPLEVWSGYLLGAAVQLAAYWYVKG